MVIKCEDRKKIFPDTEISKDLATMHTFLESKWGMYLTKTGNEQFILWGNTENVEFLYPDSLLGWESGSFGSLLDGMLDIWEWLGFK